MSAILELPTPEINIENPRKIDCLVLLGDLFGCAQYRIKIPARELKKYNVYTKEIAFLPTFPGVNSFKLLIDEFSKFDLVIIQRCYLREIIGSIRAACDFLGIPLIFETDDDYLHIPQDNPAYFSMLSKADMDTYGNDIKMLEELRRRGLHNYKEIVSMMDLVTVSTEELKRTLYPYNKNIVVFENNIEDVFAYKSWDPEGFFVKKCEDGTERVEIMQNMGMVSMPSYVDLGEGKYSPTPRIGWSSTVTHWGSDFDTIKDEYAKVIEQYSKNCWFVYCGWDRFANWHREIAGLELIRDEQSGQLAWISNPKKKQLPARVHHIPDSMYDMYLFHLRNIDIGIAPLARNVFNMSKSDIKPIEYALWGTPAVLPNFVTYARHWKHEENCLLYNNDREFKECMDEMINNHDLRVTLGKNAKKYVEENRLERLHSKRRYDCYRELIDKTHRLKTFTPEPTKEVKIDG